MIYTFFGLILLSYAFFLGFSSSRNHIESFFRSIIILIFTETVLAIVLAYLHLFTYQAVIVIHIIMNFVVIFMQKSILRNIVRIKWKILLRNNYLLMLLVVLVGLQLWSVHYHYNGKISTEKLKPIDVKNFQYEYPYFSDEWYAIALSSFMIKENKLPIINPLDANKGSFRNVQIPYHSFNAGILQLLRLNPLTGHVILSIVANTILVVLVYLYIISRNVSHIIGFFSCMLMTHLTNGANLPGLWNYIPINLALVMFICLLYLVTQKNEFFVLFSALLSMVYYPPLIVFVIPILLAYYYNKFKISLKTLAIIGVGIVIVFFFIFITIRVGMPHFKAVLFYFLNKVYYPSFTSEYIANFNPIFVLSPIVIIMFVLGFSKAMKKEPYIILSIHIGALFWFAYFFITERLILEHERSVFVTAILISLVSCYGFINFFEYVKNKNIVKWIMVGLILYILWYSLGFTKLNRWDSLHAYHIEDHSKHIMPKAPANFYLQPDEFMFFSQLSNQTFLSTPWKGTVLGVSTNNYPLLIKDGTLSFGSPELLNGFIGGDCEERFNIVAGSGYVYSPIEVECEKLVEVFQSKEGYTLYRIR